MNRNLRLAGADASGDGTGSLPPVEVFFGLFASSEVNPRRPHGGAGVALAPSIVVTFSEPVDPNTVDGSSLTLTKADLTPIAGRVVMGAGNRSASFLPDANLEPITGYVLTATTAILDTTGNPLLPFTSSFTTLDDSIPELNPDALTVSFPDDSGFVTIEATPFSFEAGASVTIVNLTNGVVVTGNVASDGSLFFQIRASITDELQNRVLDASDRELVIEKTAYQGPNGEVAIGRRRGTISVGDFVLEVPDGALTGTSGATPIEAFLAVRAPPSAKTEQPPRARHGHGPAVCPFAIRFLDKEQRLPYLNPQGRLAQSPS